MRKAKLYALTLAAVMAVGSAPVYTYGSPAEEVSTESETTEEPGETPENSPEAGGRSRRGELLKKNPRKSRKHRKMRMGRHLPQSQRHRKGKKSLRQHREQVLRLRQVPRPLH